jgi:hypothetical protein
LAGNKFTLDVSQSLKALEKSLEGIAPAVEEQINSAIQDLAHAAYANIVAKAQTELHSTRLDYLKGLEFQQLDDNSYLISLDGAWANKLEDGFPAYNLTEVLLKSQKTVEVGRRTGGPWVQTSEEGNKYAYVPFSRQPHTKQAGRMGDMAASIKSMTATNAAGRKQKITSIFKDASGNPLEGKVAIGRSKNPLVDGLVKYQKTYSNAQGKQTSQAVYINYRAVSEVGKPWQHPGFAGIKAFEEAEKMLVDHLNQILRTLL